MGLYEELTAMYPNDTVEQIQEKGTLLQAFRQLSPEDQEFILQLQRIMIASHTRQPETVR